MIAGVLLAAGGARRFGSQKLVAEWRGAPIVRHAATLLRDVTDGLVVVVGAEAEAVRGALGDIDGFVVENAAWADGLATSLACAIRALDPEVDAIVVALGDQPRLDSSVVRGVIERWRVAGRPIVRARYRGVGGHPVLFARSEFYKLLELTGDAGARTLIESAPERLAYVDVDAAVPRDVDVAADLASLDD